MQDRFKHVDLDAAQKRALVSIAKLIYGQSDPSLCQYGLFVEFLDVAAALTTNVKKRLTLLRDLSTNAVEKLAQATQRVAEMDALSQQWRAKVVQLKEEGESAAQTERDIETISCQIDRAKDLLTSLHDYELEWTLLTTILQEQISSCPMNATLASGVMLYSAHVEEVSFKHQFHYFLLD